MREPRQAAKAHADAPKQHAAAPDSQGRHRPPLLSSKENNNRADQDATASHLLHYRTNQPERPGSQELPAPPHTGPEGAINPSASQWPCRAASPCCLFIEANNIREMANRMQYLAQEVGIIIGLLNIHLLISFDLCLQFWTHYFGIH